jgi:hypothetical protein
MQVTLKSGANKGNRRIWIEGSRLTDAGLPHGTVLTRTMDGDALRLTTDPAATGRRHRIAGTQARPILDLCGKWVTAFMDGHVHFTATLEPGGITITPVDA